MISSLKSRFILPLFAGVLLTSVSCEDEKVEGATENEVPAYFLFKENIATEWKSSVQLGIKTQKKDIEKIELKLNDSIIKTWNSPSDTVSFILNTELLGVGAKHLDLLTTMKSGESFVDNRILRVVSNIKPEIWNLKVNASFPHNPSSFTQGLAFANNNLYEGTGQYGESWVGIIDIATGAVKPKIELDGTQFGEGITILNDVVYQLTWKSGRCFTYSSNSLKPQEKEFGYVGEGWGICNDGTNLIMSDGSERITFRDPSTFAIVKTIEVYTNNAPVTNLNELEYVDGFIFANVWMTDLIAVIDPSNGRVVAQIDGAQLRREGRGVNGEVMNGIAYNPNTQQLLMTGKRWEKMFDVTLIKPSV